MTISEKATKFYTQYVENSNGLLIWVSCLEDSETYSVINELYVSGIVTVEKGCVLDENEKKTNNRYGIRKIKNLLPN